jgi:hypothetical protein
MLLIPKEAEKNERYGYKPADEACNVIEKRFHFFICILKSLLMLFGLLLVLRNLAILGLLLIDLNPWLGNKGVAKLPLIL